MPDVGAEQHVKFGAIGIRLAIECVRIGRVVGFASKIKVVDEQIADIFRLLNLARGVIVELAKSARGAALIAFNDRLEAARLRHKLALDPLPAVLPAELR